MSAVAAQRRLTLVVHALHTGGAERMAALMADGWARRGIAVTLITLDSVASDEYAVDARVVRIGLNLMRESRWFLDALHNNRRRLRALRRAVRDSHPDAVIALGDKTAILTLLACRGLSVDVFVYEQVDFRRLRIGRTWSWLRQWTYPRCRALVVLSERLRAAGRKLVRGRPVYVIPNAVVLPPVNVRVEGEGNREPILFAMGRLDHQKGFDLLLPAFARIAPECPEWTLRILGEGPQRPLLEELASRLQLRRRVQLAGRVADPAHELLRGGLFVLSSRFEGFPLALLEAMTCGLPAVSFDCPTGPGEIIRHEVDGLPVPPLDTDALAAAIRRLLGNDAERRRMARRAVEAGERFGVECFLKRWEAVLSGMPEDDFTRANAATEEQTQA